MPVRVLRASPPVDAYLFVIDEAAVPFSLLAKAMTWVERSLAQTGVRLRWGGANPRSAPEMLIHVRLAAGASDDAPRAAAYSLPFAIGIREARIALDRIRPTMEAQPGLAAALLGHIIAHEVAHILAGSDGHSATGLMKAVWSGPDYAEMARRALPLSESYIRMIQMRIRARFDRSCQSVSLSRTESATDSTARCGPASSFPATPFP